MKKKDVIIFLHSDAVLKHGNFFLVYNEVFIAFLSSANNDFEDIFIH